MKEKKLLKSLAEIFLSYLDLDEAYFKISRIIIDDKCTVEVQSLDSNNNIVNFDLITLTSEEYSSWGTDDSYIVNLVASKLNFTTTV
jgi:hypothetical protein